MSPERSKPGPDPSLTAGDPARLFIIGGLLLVISGLIFGDLYAIFILHPNAANIGNSLSAAASAAAAGDPDGVFGHFGMVGAFLENAGTKKDAHVHLIHAGYLAFIMAFLQPSVALDRRLKTLLARAYLFAAVVLPVSIFLIYYVGLVYSPLETIGWASIFADLSGLLLAGVLTVELYGMWRQMRGQGDTGKNVFRLEGSNSRILLGGGIALVLAGFLFGAWYAGAHAPEHEQRELTILGDILVQASAQQTDAMNQGLAAYGGLQVERAVTIAAHAHVIEFGLLALMLAIVQPYVFLSRAWRRRLVWMMLGGAVVLPVAVYAEMWYGLPAMFMADSAGLLLIIALFGMLIGVLRYTGKTDAAQGGAV